MNKKIKKTLIIGGPILLFFGIAIPLLCILIGNSKTVLITYQSVDANKGTVSNSQETIKIKKDAAGSTAIPKTGYNFVNWTMEGVEVSKEITFVPEKVNGKNLEANYVANFEGKKFNVSFSGNFEGTEYSTVIEETYGSKFILPTEDPVQEFYNFLGWFTEAEEGTQVTDETTVELESDITLYAHWESACVAEGTLITMRDGSMKAIEMIEIGDEIKTFDHETGESSYSEVCFVWETLSASNAFTLHFENSIDVTVIQEHGFYDTTERNYAFINFDNANEYIGHEFYNVDNNNCVELVSVEKVDRKVNAYAIVTADHLNHTANGMLSMCDGIVVYLANVFEYDENMQFDKVDVENSINAYGLFDKAEFLAKYQGWSSEEFDDYNLEYLSIAIGKGIMTQEELEAINEQCIAFNESLLLD